ncbi:Hypothetical protein MSYG_4223 [Malassezia sympodialis ATCC 42132]|uniref:Uncharacterized protein n=1 Tax=Malassezia sympodialis (strain ATCC 42132) TaxID=1230383 RepID=A0A1M8ABR8_MALS4|nr:Hypothetical protein MSYG_4223 [Malassezia sympodialis ATCC 42132]
MRLIVALAWVMLVVAVKASDMARDIGNDVSRAIGGATSIVNGAVNGAASAFSQGASQATSAYCNAVSQSCGQPTVSAKNPTQSYSGAIGKVYTYGEAVSGAPSILNPADKDHPAGSTVGVGKAPADGSDARRQALTTSSFVGLACVVGAIGAMAVFL